MQNALSDLFRLAIIVSLSDKEQFVNKLAGAIEDFNEDPEKAEKWARYVVDYLKEMKENMNRERVYRNAIVSSGMPDKEQIEKLTRAIEDLTKELKQQKQE